MVFLFLFVLVFQLGVVVHVPGDGQVLGRTALGQNLSPVIATARCATWVVHGETHYPVTLSISRSILL